MDCVSIKDQRTKDVPIAVLGVLDRRWEILDYGSFLVVIAQSGRPPENDGCTWSLIGHNKWAVS